MSLTKESVLSILDAHDYPISKRWIRIKLKEANITFIPRDFRIFITTMVTDGDIEECECKPMLYKRVTA